MRVCDEEILKTAMTYLKYNKDTGEFKWVFKRPGPQREGNVAGTKDASGYIKIWLCGSQHYAHRLAWLVTYGEWPGGEIDHINRDRSDNRLCNLRDVDRAANCANTGMRSDNKSGYRNVIWDKSRDKWLASKKVNGKTKHIGYFNSPEEANEAVQKWMIREAPEGVPVLWRAPIAT